MNIVINKFVEVLSASPEPVLTPNNLGVRRPSNGSEIPAVVLSLIIEDYKGIGMGRLIRSGDTVVKNTSVVEVRSTPETFSSDLKSLRLWPLPLKKNPSSTKREFTDNDVSIRNVTDLSHPIGYRMVDKPTQKEEYKLDVTRAQIIFEEAQIQGEKLEVTHWTVTWRNEVRGERYSGVMNVEIWSDSFNSTDEISRRLQDKLKEGQTVLKQKGFMKLLPASLEPVANMRYESSIGSPFSVWNQKLAYKFTFDAEEGGELSSGIPIKRIDVDMDEHIKESFSVS